MTGNDNIHIKKEVETISEREETEEISLKEIILRILLNWKWFAAGILIMLVIAFFYLYCTTPNYRVSSSIILKDVRNQRRTSIISGGEELQLHTLGAINNLDNEIYIIKSRSTISNVINRLNLHTSYIVKGRIKSSDLYTNSPIIVSMEQSQLNTLKKNIEFVMTLNDNLTKINIKGIIGGVETDTTFTHLPAQIHTPVGDISFTKREGKTDNSPVIHVTVMHPNAVIGQYRRALSVEQATRMASVLNLSINTYYPQKGIDFLNMLVEVYNNETIEDNRIEAYNTQNFINERIRIIDGELSDAEQNVEDYKLRKGLTDLEVDLQRNMQMGSNYEQQLVKVETQLNVVNSLDDYINDPENARKTIPTNVGVEDPTLAATIKEYNQLLLDRERLSAGMTKDNPNMVRMDEQIEGLRQNVNASIKSIQQALTIQRRDAYNQANIYGGRIGSMPTQERKLMELSREQQIKASLFLMLLQKREENALELAATVNSAKVLDEALSEGIVAPRRMIILLAALLLGILIPALVLYLCDLLLYKITSRSDVDKISKVPVMCEIPHHDEESNMVVREGDDNSINEAFRIARTNLMLSLGADNKVVLITSTVSDEGKTFITINMGISMALLNKRVLLIGLDLRTPHLASYMDLNEKNGITSYLLGFEKEIDSLIQPSGIDENLFVLPAGIIPSNPAEQLSHQTLDRAIETLRERFNYIFIDSATTSQVTDTLLLNRVTDITLYVCRANYSSKNNLRFANLLMKEGKLKNMLLVINDMRYYKNWYRYGYGYGYGHKNRKRKK